jgi:hypothetical protein
VKRNNEKTHRATQAHPQRQYETQRAKPVRKKAGVLPPQRRLGLGSARTQTVEIKKGQATMIQVWNETKGHWKPARSAPERITKGKHKGKYRVMIYTGTAEHPEGLSQLIVNRDNLREIETTDPELIDILPGPDGVSAKEIREIETPPTETMQIPTIDERQHHRVIELLDAAQKAVKFGNGIKQAHLFKKAEQRSLF